MVPLYFLLLALSLELHKVLQEIFQLYCTMQPKKISMLPPPKWLETPRWSEVSKIHIHLKQYKEINSKTGISARKEGGHRTIRFHWGGEGGVDIVWNYISVRSHNYTILRCSFCLVVFNQYYISSKQVHWPLLEHWHMVFFHSYEVIQRCNSTWWERELQPKEAQLLLLPLVLHSCFFVTVKTRSLK